MKVSGNVAQVRTDRLFTLHDYYYSDMWEKALKNAVAENTVNVLEIASGDEDMIPRMMDKIFSIESQYVSFNMNKHLAQELYSKTNSLEISVLVMEEDIKLIPDYFGPEYFNLVIFQDSIEDIIQATLFHKEGIDIIDSVSMEVLPLDFAKIIHKELQEGILERNVKKEFLNLLSDCMDTMAHNGMMIFSQNMFKVNFDTEYSCEFCHDTLPRARKWILESDMMLQEIELGGFDRQWWMFLRKK